MLNKKDKLIIAALIVLIALGGLYLSKTDNPCNNPTSEALRYECSL